MNDTDCASELPPTAAAVITASRDRNGFRQTAQRFTHPMTICVRIASLLKDKIDNQPRSPDPFEDSRTSNGETPYSKYRARIGSRAGPRMTGATVQLQMKGHPLCRDVSGAALVQLPGSAVFSGAQASDGGHD